MKKYGLLFIIIMVVFNVKAITLEECTTEKMNALKEIANKMEFNYTYEMKEKDGEKYPEFTINATGLHEDIKTLIINDFYSLDYKEIKNNNGKGTITGYGEGETVTITMKAYTPDKCSTKTVAVKQVKLPYYNQFYDKEFCLTNPNFKYCDEFTDTKITIEQYNREKNKYLEEQKTEEPVTEKEQDNTFLIIGIGLGVIVIGGLVAYILIRRKKNEL